MVSRHKEMSNSSGIPVKTFFTLQNDFLYLEENTFDEDDDHINIIEILPSVDTLTSAENFDEGIIEGEKQDSTLLFNLMSLALLNSIKSIKTLRKIAVMLNQKKKPKVHNISWKQQHLISSKLSASSDVAEKCDEM